MKKVCGFVDERLRLRVARYYKIAEIRPLLSFLSPSKLADEKKNIKSVSQKNVLVVAQFLLFLPFLVLCFDFFIFWSVFFFSLFFLFFFLSLSLSCIASLYIKKKDEKTNEAKKKKKKKSEKKKHFSFFYSLVSSFSSLSRLFCSRSLVLSLSLSLSLLKVLLCCSFIGRDILNSIVVNKQFIQKRWRTTGTRKRSETSSRKRL